MRFSKQVGKEYYVCVECWVVVVAWSGEFRRTTMFMRKTEETQGSKTGKERVDVAPQELVTASKCHSISLS